MQTDADRGRSYRNRFFRMKGTQVGFILDSSKTYRLFQPDRDTTPRQRVVTKARVTREERRPIRSRHGSSRLTNNLSVRQCRLSLTTGYPSDDRYDRV